MKINDDITHSGHRQRVREKVEKYGLNSLAEHEKLEYLLFTTIPRKDVNGLAHKLINTFGGLDKVLEAPIKSLMKIKGIGYNTAIFLNSLSSLFSSYIECKNIKKPFLNSTKSIIDYFRANFIINPYEEFFMFCLNSKSYLVKTIRLSSDLCNKVNVDMKSIIDELSSIKTVTKVVVCHTHPTSSCMPSSDDDVTTAKLIYICSILNIKILDHLIFSKDEHFSYSSTKLLDKLYSNVLLSTNNIYSVFENKQQKIIDSL